MQQYDTCAPRPAIGMSSQSRRKGFYEESTLARDSREHDKPCSGNTYMVRRLNEEGLSREDTSTSYASYLETLMQDNCTPPPAVGTCTQSGRFDEESTLAKDSKQHNKPYDDSFNELDKLQEPKKSRENDNFQVVDKSHGSSNGLDSHYDQVIRRRSRFDIPPADFDCRPHISRIVEVSHERSCDDDKGRKRDDNMKRHDSCEPDKKTLSREIDQSPQRRCQRSCSRENDDRQRSWSPRGSGRCFNCGLDGHWARDCKAGDWKNKCYRCGQRGHVERNCHIVLSLCYRGGPKDLKRGHSYSRSPSPRRGRSRSRSYSRGYSPSRSPVRRERSTERVERRRSRSPRYSRSPKLARKASPPPSRGRKRSPTPDELSPPRESHSPREQRKTATRRNGSDYSESPPRARGRSLSPGENSPAAEANGHDRSPIHRDDRSPMEEEDDMRDSRRGRGGSESPSARD